MITKKHNLFRLRCQQFQRELELKARKLKIIIKTSNQIQRNNFKLHLSRRKSLIKMSNQRMKIELSPEYFRARFKILSQMHDPFSRSYLIATDSSTQKRAIYKHYLTETQQQLQAIYDNIENYMKLSQQQGVCRILAYTRLTVEQEVLAAFQYSDLSLGEYVMTQEFLANRPVFYIALLGQLTAIIKAMSQIGIDLDQLNYGNILVFYKMGNQIKIKVLYDQREKAYQKVLQGVKTFTSLEKLVAMVSGDEGYLGEMGEGEEGMAGESVYQLGLLLIDMMHTCESDLTTTLQDDFLVRDRPVSRPAPLLNSQQGYYKFEACTITLNSNFINSKLSSLRNNPLRVIKQLTQLSQSMIAGLQQRIKISHIPAQLQRIVKIYRDSSSSPSSSSLTSLSMNKNITIEGGHKKQPQGMFKRNQIKQVDTLVGMGDQQYQRQLVSYSSPQSSVTYNKLPDSVSSRENCNTMANTKQYLSQITPPPVSNLINNNNNNNVQLNRSSSSLSINHHFTQHNQPYKAKQSLNHLQNQNYLSNLKPSPRMIIIPKQTILTSLKAHQSIRVLLQNLINQIQYLAELRKKQYYDGSVYYGSISQQTNKRNGLGVYIYSSGEIYFGTWLDNQLVNGTYVFKNGQSYEGTVKIGKQGWGRYRYANGNVYEGEWRDDLKEGKGTMWYPNQDRYEGQWVKGKKNGVGKYFYNNGTIYEGNFVNGRKQGLGVITFSNGTKIQANWQQTHIQGQGKVSYSNGDYFQGQYSMSQKHGQGMYIWAADNTKYEGEFRKDALQGQARIYFTSKQYYSGRIRNGRRDGQGSYVYQNGDSFTGEWKNDVKLIGTYRFKNGEEFEGKFKDNHLHFGVLKYGNAESYQGEFKNGCRHGIGSYRDRFGALICEGHWENDNFIQHQHYQWQL